MDGLSVVPARFASLPLDVESPNSRSVIGGPGSYHTHIVVVPIVPTRAQSQFPTTFNQGYNPHLLISAFA